jgi:hypothetical protein
MIYKLTRLMKEHGRSVACTILLFRG